jgi:hypothetical protein
MPEFVEKIDGFEKTDLNSFPDSRRMFAFACEHVERYRKPVVEKCLARMIEPVTEFKFMSEYLWCVYVSGFSAKTISSKYDALLKAHNIIAADGPYLAITAENTPASLERVYSVFKNRSKANAIQETRLMILRLGWEGFRGDFVDPSNPPSFQRLPNIGPALSVHLARNLGNLDLVKPDVHLMRLATNYGHASVLDMCRSLSDDKLAKTDLILWLTSIDHGTK